MLRNINLETGSAKPLKPPLIALMSIAVKITETPWIPF